MPLQDTAADEAAEAHHLLERLSVDASQHEVVEVLACLFGHGAGGLVEADRHVQLLQRVPQRVVPGVVPVPAVDDVGADEDGLEAQLLHRSPRLRHGVVDVVDGDHARAEHPVGVDGAEVVHPVVVGASDGSAEARVDVGSGEDAQSPAGEHDGDVDALPMSIASKLAVGVPSARRVVPVKDLVLLVVVSPCG